MTKLYNYHKYGRPHTRFGWVDKFTWQVYLYVCGRLNAHRYCDQVVSWTNYQNDEEVALINSVSWFARHSCSLRPTYQGVHVACLRERGNGVPSEVFDQRYPGWIVARIRRDGPQEQGKLIRIRECRCRWTKGYLDHVPIGHNFGQCLSDFGTSGAEQKWHQVFLPRSIQGVKESVHGHSRIALKTEKLIVLIWRLGTSFIVKVNPIWPT